MKICHRLWPALRTRRRHPFCTPRWPAACAHTAGHLGVQKGCRLRVRSAGHSLWHIFIACGIFGASKRGQHESSIHPAHQAVLMKQLTICFLFFALSYCALSQLAPNIADIVNSVPWHSFWKRQKNQRRKVKMEIYRTNLWNIVPLQGYILDLYFT